MDDDYRRQLGFLDETMFRQLGASAIGRTVVVLAETASDPSHQHRLYIRGFDERTYREIPWPDGCNSFGWPVMSQTSAEMFVLGQQWRDVPTRDPARTKPLRGGDVVALYRVRLPDGVVERLHSARSDRVGPSGNAVEPQWMLSELLGVTQDGRRLLVSVGQGKSEASSIRGTYAIAEFDLGTAEVKEMTQLPAVFA